MARPRVHDDALRTRLITAAAEVLARKGVDGVSLRVLAQDCGTSTSAVYSIFGSKDGMVTAVVAEALGSFTDSQRRALSRSTAGPIERLAQLGIAYRRWALTHPSLYAVMFASEGHIKPANLPGYDGIAPLRSVVQECVDTGAFAPLHDIGDVILSIWASVHGFVSLEISQLRFTSKRAADRTYRAHLDSIARAWADAPSPGAG
jgi:AcrR family transcriptional regulator